MYSGFEKIDIKSVFPGKISVCAHTIPAIEKKRIKSTKGYILLLLCMGRVLSKRHFLNHQSLGISAGRINVRLSYQ